MTPPYQLKQPGFIPDVSSHGTGADLSVASPRPMGIIARASVAFYPSQQQDYRAISVGIDPTMPGLFQKTKQLNLTFGVYHYLLQNKIQAQAQKFIEACQAGGLMQNGTWQPEIPPIVDVEIEYQAPPKKPPQGYIGCLTGPAWAGQVKEFMDTIESALGVRPAIYTARPQWKWVCTVKNGIYTAPSWTRDYKFWVKWYPFKPFVDRNTQIPDENLPTGVTRDLVMLWQYSDEGRSDGYQYNDLNVLTDLGLLAWVQGHTDPEPGPGPSGRMATEIKYDDGSVQHV